MVDEDRLSFSRCIALRLPALQSRCKEAMMRTTRIPWVAVFSLVLVVGSCAWLQADDGRVDDALEVARAWLELVDQGEYDKSWEEAAAYFRNALDREQWQQTMSGFRRPLGEVVSRELLEAKYRSHLAGAPDGEYVVIRFKTSFSNKVDALETITPMLDPDGQWRVSGYFIK